MNRFTLFLTVTLLVIALPMDGNAQTDIKIGPRIGIPVGDVSDVGGNLFFGADARIESADLPVTINPSFDYYLMDDLAGASQTFFAIDGNALYEFEVDNSSFAPYVGGGIGIERYSAEASSQFVSVSTSTTDIGLNLVGGARFPLDSVEPFVQANFAVGGDLDRFGLAGGVLFSL